MLFFLVTSQAAAVAQSILLVLMILVPSIYVSLTPCFATISLMMAKVVQFYTINNDVYLSDVILDNNQAYINKLQ